MRILVTRPGKDGQDLVKILGDLGIDSMLEPLLTIRNLNTSSLNTEGVKLTSRRVQMALTRL